LLLSREEIKGGNDVAPFSLLQRLTLAQLHPVVVPQSSHTMQWPLTFMRMLLQLLHWSPV
jgi:hypothetical protein